jgi:hypothetical protein
MEKTLKQGLNTSEKTISMLDLNSILQPSDLLHKFTLPPSERHILLSKNYAISDEPYIPASCTKHFHKEWMTKASLVMIQNSM